MKKISSLGWMALIFTALVTIGGIMSFILDRPSPLQRHLAVVASYTQKHAFRDDYWVEQTPDQSNAVVLKEVEERLNSISGIVAATLRSGVQISPLAGQIGRQFTAVTPTISMPGERFLSLTGDLQRIGTDEHSLHICFVPADQIGEETRKVYYSNARRAIMCPAIRWPKPVASAIIIHEAGHAFRFSERGLAPLAVRRTPRWTVEEVEMHELQTLVIDHDTGGKFRRWVDSIVARIPDPETAEEVLFTVDLHDLEELDRICDSEGSGEIVAGLVLTHSMIAIGFRCIDLHAGGNLDLKVKFYLTHTGGGK